MLSLLYLALPLALAEGPKSKEIYVHEGVPREQRWKSVGHKGMTLWFTGLSGSGKSTISVALEKQLTRRQARPYFVYRLDGDNLRFGLNSDLGFSPEDRKENVRRVAEVSKLFADAGAVVLVGLISPYQADRDFARKIHDDAGLGFLEVFVDASLAVAEARDPKGLYKKARAGQIKGFTGLDAPYEAPPKPEIHIHTDQESVPVAVNRILRQIDAEGLHLSPDFNLMEDEMPATCST